jgi:hypothetical protein
MSMPNIWEFPGGNVEADGDIFSELVRETDLSQPEQRIYLSTLIYFIDYLLQLPDELSQKLRTEIILTKEVKEMWHLGRKNLPPTLGELIEVIKEEGRDVGMERGMKRGLEEGQKQVAIELIKDFQ